MGVVGIPAAHLLMEVSVFGPVIYSRFGKAFVPVKISSSKKSLA